MDVKTAVSFLSGSEGVRLVLSGLFLGMCGVQDLRSRRVSLAGVAAAGAAAFAMEAAACLLGTTDAAACLLEILPGLFLLLLSFAAKGAAGAGDGACFMVLGGFVGLWRTAAVLAASLLLASAAGIVCLALKKAHGKTRLPFLTFAAAAWTGILAAQAAGIRW